jgi:integrase/recombinase XerC
MRAAFAAGASAHEPASMRRCWSTWNVLCDFLYTAELIAANPMAFVRRPKPAKTLPRCLLGRMPGRAGPHAWHRDYRLRALTG